VNVDSNLTATDNGLRKRQRSVDLPTLAQRKAQVVKYIRIDMSSTERASMRFACLAHGEQCRNDGSPYTDHLWRVAKHAISFGNRIGFPTEAMKCAAWLHDVVEDTDKGFEEIRKLFKEPLALDVVTIVAMLTGKAEHNFANVAATLSPFYAVLGSRELRLVADAYFLKLCDRLDNLSSMQTWTPERKNKYFDETRRILDVGVNNRLIDPSESLLFRVVDLIATRNTEAQKTLEGDKPLIDQTPGVVTAFVLWLCVPSSDRK